MKKFHNILLILGVGLLVCLLWKIGVGELWRELGLLGWGLAPLMLGEGVAEMIHTLGWRHCLTGSLRSLSWFTLFRIRMAGYAFNYLTPTAALGGEVTKGALLAAHQSGPEAASGVLIGKSCFAMAHLIFVSLGSVLVLWQIHLPKALWLGMLTSGALLGTGIITFLWLQRHGKLGALVRWLARNKPENHPLQKAAREITSVDEAMMQFHRERPKDLVMAIAWHLTGYSIGIVQTWFFFRLLHNDATWVVAAGMWFLGMWFDLLTFAVPLNLGTLEGTRILAFQSAGYTALIGMTYGLAQRLAQITWTVFGLACHAVLARHSRTSSKATVTISSPQPIAYCTSSSDLLQGDHSAVKVVPSDGSTPDPSHIQSQSCRAPKHGAPAREQPLNPTFKASKTA